MIIVAGHLTVAPEDRDTYLRAVAPVTVQARATPGCLDFVQAADPVDPARINILERWEDEARLLAFRGSGEVGGDVPPILGAEVRDYRVTEDH